MGINFWGKYWKGKRRLFHQWVTRIHKLQESSMMGTLHIYTFNIGIYLWPKGIENCSTFTQLIKGMESHSLQSSFFYFFFYIFFSLFSFFFPDTFNNIEKKYKSHQEGFKTQILKITNLFLVTSVSASIGSKKRNGVRVMLVE